MQRLLVVDGHNFLFKSYAVPFKFYSSKGTPLHVATTFLSMLRRAADAVDADSVVIVFDSQEKNSNNVLSDSYKANRKQDYSQDEDSPFIHLPLIKKSIDYLNLGWIEEPGVEADDLIATISTQFTNTANENKVFIASSDSDFFQIISDKIKVIQLKSKGEYLILDEEHVVKTFGVNPASYVELKSWVGDKVDNIQGISGIGWKRALEIKQGKRERILTLEEKQLIELNRKLIKLNCELDIDYEVTEISSLVEKFNKGIFEVIDK